MIQLQQAAAEHPGVKNTLDKLTAYLWNMLSVNPQHDSSLYVLWPELMYKYGLGIQCYVISVLVLCFSLSVDWKPKTVSTNSSLAPLLYAQLKFYYFYTKKTKTPKKHLALK